MLMRYTAENTQWVVEYSNLEYRKGLGLGLLIWSGQIIDLLESHGTWVWLSRPGVGKEERKAEDWAVE